MKEKISRLKEQISSKEKLCKELKKSGDENRAFQLFSEAQKLKSELILMTKFQKL